MGLRTPSCVLGIPRRGSGPREAPPGHHAVLTLLEFLNILNKGLCISVLPRALQILQPGLLRATVRPQARREGRGTCPQWGATVTV